MGKVPKAKSREEEEEPAEEEEGNGEEEEEGEDEEEHEGSEGVDAKEGHGGDARGLLGASGEDTSLSCDRLLGLLDIGLEER